MSDRYIKRKNRRKLTKLIQKIKKIAISVNKSHKWDKIFLCINQEDTQDILVLPYNCNENMKKCLGRDCLIEIPSGKRENNTICLVEYTPSDNSCKIFDGRSIYNC